jgi:hypothetical protein
VSSRVRVLPFLVALGAVSLLFAMWAGLMRAGWAAAQLQEHHPLAHGPLMICGFLGTIIGLEKARGLDLWWGYLAPALSGAGAIALLLWADPQPARILFVLAGVMLTVVSADLARRHVDPAALLIVAGSLAWTVGSFAWLNLSIPQIVSWWMAFPVLIIVGERLELTRVLPRSRAALNELFAELALYAVGLGLLFWRFDLSFRVQGLALALIAVWLLRHDLARRTLRSGGVYRYTAVCLICGFVWLAIAGVLLASWGMNLTDLRYDTVLHAVLLGFVFGMILGHVPIIAPMLFGRQLAFDRSLYAPLVLLQASLLLRLSSSMVNWLPGRAWGAAFNVAAVLLFLATAARAFRRGRKISPNRPGSP